MLKTTLTAAIAVLAFVFTLSIVNAVSAEGSKGAQSIKVPPGAKVQVHGNSAMISGGGGGSGVTGTFECVCDKGGGSCSIGVISTTMNCFKGTGDTCSGSCYLYSKTSGNTGPAAAKANGNTGPAAPNANGSNGPAAPKGKSQ
jgi:hypothetical protein